MAWELQTNLKLEANPIDPKHVPHIQWVIDYVTRNSKAPVQAVSVNNLAGTYDDNTMTLTLTAAGPLVIDGVTLALGNRLFLVGQTDGTQNGIFDVTVEGDASTPAQITRSDDFNSSEKIIQNVLVPVSGGTNYGGTTWRLTTGGTIILDTTALVFEQVVTPKLVTKHAETITGDDSTDEWEIEHNLNTTDISVSVWNINTNAPVLTNVEIVDANTVMISFANTLTPAQIYRVVVMG
jgi:hypothetical protein